MPDRISEAHSVGVFDRFASWTTSAVSRAPFFAFCVLLIVVWVPSILILRDVDTWQLIINTATTIVTFLLVALLQNSQARFETAVHWKNDAIATGLRDLMDHVAHQMPCSSEDCDFEADIRRLERVVGIEENVGTKEPS